ncbi:putative otospiralin-like [Triplophysa rosa]|uniref:Otospiralin-like n=1 Tax=Triplophysa rosa TaxID=992332 RepID=A0A9W8C6K3_TRIRA|nr:putative otospiralin-like [Triplophysa rosa]
MSRICVLLCTSLLIFCYAAGAENGERYLRSDEGAPAQKESRVKRSLPYWNLWSSDFYGWVEELRSQSGYDTLQDLARTYWAHFPIASFLGYETNPEPEEHPEQKVDN